MEFGSSRALNAQGASAGQAIIMEYKPTIGLEIHAHLKTKSKMFCASPNNPDEKHPNVNVCPICMGHPGVLPVINEEAVQKTIKAGLALNCQIAKFSKFDRKNYFYPDLPKGYQISQYDLPFCQSGYLEIGGRRIRITRMHLEEDAGKLVHDEKTGATLVDFNRAGVPLMELVTEPDITSGKEARVFAEELRLIFRYLGASDADMEKGQMRVEVNLSLGKEDKLGTKVEVKNLNSFKVVEQAIDYEIERQKILLEEGQPVVQETRGWDEAKQRTVSQRTKEEAQDYRYFPEPDLPPLTFTDEQIARWRAELPELPASRRLRFAQEYGLPVNDIEVLVQNKDLGHYYEKTTSEFLAWLEVEGREPKSKEEKEKLYKLAANYLLTDLNALIQAALLPMEELQITPEDFAEFITMIYEGKITSKSAKEILKEMFQTGKDPSNIIEERGLNQVSDVGEIEKAVDKVIEENPKPSEDYKSGKQEVIQFLIGKVMAATKGKANPAVVREILGKKLMN
jgi:aspartyl-tRNA(Asn)/glutamyl-tRNA(Gln) amidotransferase subunit B